MQLKTLFGGVLLGIAVASAAHGQSLSPMHNKGPTPSDTKGFKLVIANPYPKAMTFVIIPMDTAFENAAPKAVVRPNEVRLGAGLSRTVTVAFKIDPGQKERTIGVCVQPKEIEGSILPRVCGTYTGIMAGAGIGRPGG
jgi:hypothetical protein